jgi:hypothetical protein
VVRTAAEIGFTGDRGAERGSYLLGAGVAGIA